MSKLIYLERVKLTTQLNSTCCHLNQFLSGRAVGSFWTSSFENSASVFEVLLVGNVSLPVRSHEFHGLLSLETVEHVLAHQRILSVSVHLIAEAQLLLLVDLSLHVVVFDLVKEGCSGVVHIYFSVRMLVFSSRRVLDWEWVEVSGSL